MTATRPRSGSLAEQPGLNDKSKILVEGPNEDIILLYNSSPAAPSIAKDIKGDFIFLADAALVCIAQSIPDESYSWFVQRLVPAQGGREVRQAAAPCDPATLTSSADLLSFKRGELLKQGRDYILRLAKLIETDEFSAYRVVTATEYEGEIQSRHALSLKFAEEVEKNQRSG